MNVRMLRKLEKWIMAEPRRFDMRSWSGDEQIVKKNKPPCGTVGCLAGMACHMQGHKLQPGENSIVDGDFISDTAAEILGLDSEESDRLFFLPRMHRGVEFHWPVSFAAAYKKAKTPAAKVKVAVARIEHFIKTKGAE